MTPAQSLTMGKGNSDVDVDSRCYSSPTMYHKPGAIHFINKAHTEFVRGCRYCEVNFSYVIRRNTEGDPVILPVYPVSRIAK